MRASTDYKKYFSVLKAANGNHSVNVRSGKELEAISLDPVWALSPKRGARVSGEFDNKINEEVTAKRTRRLQGVKCFS